MAVKSDFSEEEWAGLEKGVTGAGLYVSLADRGFFDTFKEVGALSKHLKEAREHNPSTLVRDLAAVRGTGFGMTERPEAVEKETLEALQSAVGTLQAKAPDEVDAYRSFVLDIAESVAKAAGGVADSETGAIEKIRTALDS